MSNLILNLKPATTYRGDTWGKHVSVTWNSSAPSPRSPYLSGGVAHTVQAKQVSRVGHGVVLGDGDRQRTLQVLGVLIDLHLTAQAGSLLQGDVTICPLGKGGRGSQIYGVCVKFPNIFVLIIIIIIIIIC